MQLQVARDNDLVFAKTEGRITSAALDNQPEPLAAAGGAEVYSQRILLDLSESDYIDSSGVSWLLTCRKKVRESGGRLVLHSINTLVWQMLKVLRLNEMFLVADNATAARKLAEGDAT